ncbi:hypothetical protein ACIPW5_12800 [Streptomyces sp. NPDC090077]|uniref:hypothetical protein n=1 Tax=Streptomyces sp. NPDC090077 TaxID=3365938 RepID=UPI003821E4FA
MRTTTPAAMSATATALACAALLTVTGCGPGAGPAAKEAPAASAAPDPLAGRDPAAVLRAAYQETARAETKNALVKRTIGDREISAQLTFEGDGGCWGKVTVAHAGTGEILMEGGRLSVKGDEGFLKDHFRDPTASYPDSGQGWIDSRTSDPSVAHLRTLCAAARPDQAFPAEPADVRREPDARQNGKPVAVFRPKAAGGAEVTDHVLLDAVPYLVKHDRQGPDSGSVEYTGVRRSG